MSTMTDRERAVKLARRLGLTPHPKHWDKIESDYAELRADERLRCMEDCEQIEADLGDEHDELCDCVTAVEDACNCHLSSFRKTIAARHSSEVLKKAAADVNRLIEDSIVEKFEHEPGCVHHSLADLDGVIGPECTCKDKETR